MDGARGIIMEVTWRHHPNLAVFFVLGHNNNLVIRFPIIRTPRAHGETSTQLSLSCPLAIVAF
jgi:hypothetical protein